MTGKIDFPQMERDILHDWQQHQVFARSVQQRRAGQPYIFYDGPPFANGLPHYGHILANTIKDVVPRYWTMRGYYVERRFGWDCHGLPVEYEIEKREKFTSRQDILQLGIDRFNEMCRQSVVHYCQQWQRTITRIGRWVDWNNQYHTMDLSYMESVWWVCQRLAEKGLLYRDHKVVPYSPRITTVLSNFEANQNYQDVQDPAITVKLPANDEDAYFLIWTTTPWTLPANLAVAVAEDLTYCKITDHQNNESYYLANEALARLYSNSDQYTIDRQLTGRELSGRSYQPLFPFAKRTDDRSFRVLTADFVNTDEGTGIVHLAPSFGEDDYRLCKTQAIDHFDPLDNEARFTDCAGPFSGLSFKEADKKIIRDLKERQLIIRHDTIVHRYPYCERTNSPLIYRAIPAWYVAVEKFKDRLVANNNRINWLPAHLQQGRFGNWLENAKDWAISRNRFWGTPLPIWLCEDDTCQEMIVVGSVQQLEEVSGQKITDLHKHVVDNLTFACKECQRTMRRVPEVLDCWFESGSMPCAQVHYPFSQKAQPPPANFIAEGLDQTRGWFYTLNVLSTALFDQPAFHNVVVNGTILNEQGKKMSKRHRNYTPPDDLIDKYGADAVRLYLLNSPLLRAEDLRFSDKGVVDTIRTVLLPLWNAQHFFTTYATAAQWSATSNTSNDFGDHRLDRWIVSKLQSLIKDLHQFMEGYQLSLAVPRLVEFIDLLTNSYIRLNRRRFWEDDNQAFTVLRYVLINFCQLLAPFAPFISERIYRQLSGDQSVHLCDSPMFNAELHDQQLENEMQLVTTVLDLGRRLRAKHQLKTRQVLSKLLVITDKTTAAQHYRDLLKDELNVKQLQFSTDEQQYVSLTIKPNLKKLGARLGKRLKQLRSELSTINASQKSVSEFIDRLQDKGVTIAGASLHLDDFIIDRQTKSSELAVETGNGLTVLLDTNLTEQLIAEGLAREVVNRVQKSRKEFDLQVTDRIELLIVADQQLNKAIEQFSDYICSETLATQLLLPTEEPSSETAAYGYRENFTIDNQQMLLLMRKST